MDLRNPSNQCFLLLIFLCTILGRLVFYFKTNPSDVFLNYIGEDAGYGIISYLDDALSRRIIKTFNGTCELPKGEVPDLESPLPKEIEGSRVAVVVFSKGYASSHRCLRMLVRITQCHGIRRLKVLPIFYRIDPSDVRNQNGSFQAAFERHEKGLKDELHIVQGWRAALMEVSSLAGLDSRLYTHETDLVKQAVDDVVKLLRASRSADEAAAGRAYLLFCIFFPVVILLHYKKFWRLLFSKDFRSSVSVTATILCAVFLGFYIHDRLVYWRTLDSYYDVLPFSILRSNPRSASERSVLIVILLVLIGTIGTLWGIYMRSGEQGEADQFNSSGSNAHDDDEEQQTSSVES